MPPVRFVHAADLHLDSPFAGLGAGAPAHVAQALRDATFMAFENIVELCIRERVDALLVAGDIYDGADRSLRAQLRFFDGLRRLGAAGVRSFICHGNHDPLDGWEAGITLPPGCHRFGATVERVPLDPADPGRGTVYGVSYPKRDVRASLVPGFGRAPEGISIGLLHANVNGDPNHEAYAPCTVDQLAATGIRYWALGHVHTRKVLRDHGPAVVYPGNPQGRHANETGERGVYLVEMGDQGRPLLDFRPVDVVRWRVEELSIAGLADDQALHDSIAALCERTLEASAGRDVICRLVIAGRGELHESLRRVGYVQDLRQSINDQWAARSPFLWCESVVDGTRRLFDRERAREAGDFLSEVLAVSDRAQSDTGTQAAIAGPLQAMYGHERVRRYLREGAPTGEELRELVAAAEALCVDELLEGEE